MRHEGLAIANFQLPIELHGQRRWAMTGERARGAKSKIENRKSKIEGR
jgi:hypothetical protein